LSARSVQPMPPHPVSPKSIIILSIHLCLSLLSGVFPTNNPYAFLFPHSCCVPYPSQSL
jgi:hypothetical protein